jgi:acetyl esterase/lipase
VLTPTTTPSGDALRQMREAEAAAGFSAPVGTPVVEARYANVDCLRLEIGEHQRTAIYFHGGGYLYTRAAEGLSAVAALATRCQMNAVAPEYRRAPESPFPADIVLAGDSAGGGLALACLIAAGRAALPVPAAGVVFSPWTDLAVEGDSADAADDPVVDGAGLRSMAETYLAGGDARSPLASPLYATDAELAALPPLLVQVGTREALLDDRWPQALESSTSNTRTSCTCGW